ncbi:MAG: hydroxymethylbilane synthase [Acidimicrobiales bacterium]|nr:hydroxymethylbilane synthase [Acidimicrobiales bacterium]
MRPSFNRSNIKIATRKSPLAMWQATFVKDQIENAFPGSACSFVPVETIGDKKGETSLAEIRGIGVFATEVRQAVAEGLADIAVHSAKDIPADSYPGLEIACVPKRGDPRDVLVGSKLADLNLNATVATGSQRRKSQLKKLRPDLNFVDLRGNISTRLAKIPENGAILMAYVALLRLNLLEDNIVDLLPIDIFTPQVGQGALACECVSINGELQELLHQIDDEVSHAEVAAERSFLSAMGGGCTSAIGAYCGEVDGYVQSCEGSRFNMQAMLANEDGSLLVRESFASESNESPEIFGIRVATTMKLAAEEIGLSW